MFESINNWIISILSLGIITVFIELIMPNGKNKKYVYVLIGLLTIVTIIDPVISYVSNGEFSTVLEKSFEGFSVTASSDKDLVNDNIVKDRVITSMKNDIKDRLNNKVKDIYILMTDEYETQKISITLDEREGEIDIDSLDEIVDSIIKEYEIDYSQIEIIKEN